MTIPFSRKLADAWFVRPLGTVPCIKGAILDLIELVPLIIGGVIDASIAKVLVLLVSTSEDNEQISKTVHSVAVSSLRRSAFWLDLLPVHTVDVHQIQLPKIIQFLTTKITKKATFQGWKSLRRCTCKHSSRQQYEPDEAADSIL